MKDIKIFIIEDDFLFINILVNIIELLNSDLINDNIKISYSTFYSAKEAEFEFKQNPDIILLDYFIIDDEHKADTGVKVIKSIKEKELDIDIIIVSGQESEAVKKQLLNNGVYGYISKNPEDLKKIKPLIIEIINKRTK